MSSETKPDKGKSKGRPKSERVPVENPSPSDLRFMSHKARAALRAKALAMFEECGDKTKVADEFGIDRGTLRKWIIEAGMDVKRGSEQPPDVDDPEDEDGEFSDEVTDEDIAETEEELVQMEADRETIAGLTEQEKTDIIRIGMLLAREREMEIIETGASGSESPQDAYQSYAANLGMKILRDNKSKIRGPRTVKELAELDAFIRRNLGLDNKGKGGGGGGGGALHVDVKILNQGPLPPGEIAKGPVVDVTTKRE